MKAVKSIFKVLAAIAAIAGIAVAIYLVIQRVMGDKKTAAYYDDEDFFDCDCDLCDVIECDEDIAQEAVADLEAEAKGAQQVAKAVKNAKSK